jgi:hypothetical protein
MSILTVQLNHPGAEKPFKLGKGYSYFEGKLIREWNADKSHYRKFIRQEGEYIKAFDQQPTKDELLFWGEWEGNSYFEHLNRWNPNGIHQPFHSLHIRHHQNTDPYIYGEHFLYSVCKQRGRLTQLEKGSVVLFGSSFKNGFVLDTVFVVGSFESVHEVAANEAANYSKTYREATLEQLGDTYVRPTPASKLRLYKGLMYAENQELFSYTPCKPYKEETKTGFPRVIFPYENLAGFQFSNNPTGIKIISSNAEQTKEIWNYITKEVLKQGYFLGVKLNEPNL